MPLSRFMRIFLSPSWRSNSLRLCLVINRTNSWMLYDQLTSGTKKYVTLRSNQLQRAANNSPVIYIVDPWNTPLAYYRPISNVAYSVSNTNDIMARQTCFTIGGQVNVATYDLFSYGPDQRTYVPWANNLWCDQPVYANDDIGNSQR